MPGGSVNGQTSMLLTHHHGMHSLLNTTLFSNTPGGAVIVGSDASLVPEGQFYAPGNFRLTSSDRRHSLYWEEPANRYLQLCHEINHFAWCIGQSLIDSPIHPLDRRLPPWPPSTASGSRSASPLMKNSNVNVFGADR